MGPPTDWASVDAGASMGVRDPVDLELLDDPVAVLLASAWSGFLTEGAGIPGARK